MNNATVAPTSHGQHPAPQPGLVDPSSRPSVRSSARRADHLTVLPPLEKSPRRKPRIALYAHDTMGLGHTRRNLLIAGVLSGAFPGANIVLVAGTRMAANFTMPPGIDLLTLPALFKEPDGRYRSRHLDLGLNEFTTLRARTIRAALLAFDPDLLVVDNVPRGALGELDRTLRALRARGRTQVVLGLRDVLDEPEAVAREWGRLGNEEAIRAYYDAIWVYGDPKVYDTAREYRFAPDIAAKVSYTGYLDQRQRLELDVSPDEDPLSTLRLPPGRLALCVMGGGQDGATLARTFVQTTLPPGTNGLLLTGPFMPPNVQEELHALAAHQPRLRVLTFVKEPGHLIARADAVIAMGGYNTTAEILSFAPRALIVPRVTPRREQLIRATRLRDLGLVDVLHPDRLNPRALEEWLARRQPSSNGHRTPVDLQGLCRLPALVTDVTRIDS